MPIAPPRPVASHFPILRSWLAPTPTRVSLPSWPPLPAPSSWQSRRVITSPGGRQGPSQRTWEAAGGLSKHRCGVRGRRLKALLHLFPLCDLKQVTSPLRASASSSANRDKANAQGCCEGTSRREITMPVTVGHDLSALPLGDKASQT